MIRVMVVLFWVGLLIGTLVAHNVVTNWAVTLGGLYFLARWWSHRHQHAGSSQGPRSPALARSANAAPASSAAATTSVSQPRSRWTVDRVHTSERRWR
jgi:hypothetical protein